MLEQSNKAYSLLNVNPQTFLNKNDQTNQLSMQLKYSKRQQNSHIINPQTKFKLKAKDNNKLKEKCKKLQEFSSYLLYSNNNVKQQALHQYQHENHLKNITLQHHHHDSRVTASQNHNQPTYQNEHYQKKQHNQPLDNKAVQQTPSIRRTQRKNYHKITNATGQDPKESQSQSKRQKKVAQSGIHTYGRNNHPLQNDSHSHSNIFNNQILKQQSYHSLDKSQREQVYNRIVGANSKIESKLHLPQLNSGIGSNIKTINSKKSKQYSNMRQKQLNNQTIHQQYQQQHQQHQQQYSNEMENLEKSEISGSKRSKISPSEGNVNKSKVIKIPVDRLKQLKPQEIRLKFQRKIKQEQKNRAKQMAIDIFNRDEHQNTSNSKLNIFDDLQQDGGIRIDSLIRNW